MKALDIDGVLCPFTEEVYVPAMNEVLGTNFSMKDAEQNDWGYQIVFGITREEEIRVWESEALIKYMKIAKPIPKGVELVKSYMSAGLDHCFITARASHKLNERAFRVRAVTKNWIKEVTGSDKPVYFYRSGLKHIKAKELGVHTMVEDNPETVKLLADEGIYVFMPVYKYNEMIEQHDFIIPVENWLENE